MQKHNLDCVISRSFILGGLLNVQNPNLELLAFCSCADAKNRWGDIRQRHQLQTVEDCDTCIAIAESSRLDLAWCVGGKLSSSIFISEQIVWLIALVRAIFV